MTTIIVLPHPDLAPAGAQFDAPPGSTICDALLDNGIEIEHACGKVGACTTCHVIVKNGFESLNDIDDNEEDLLDRAWGLQPTSRLSCQARIADSGLVVEIPRYTLNQVKENG
ncbi:ISC system 2Fe-2S type ferredoxin [Massilia eurypsychrophila]|jgi:2Fe-2S ferredoxin|uniref:2Fe-2S ferredoxin n=1 Tax=Massilia eurypsychrophila TaxID=1485217 RepID=A0A2G8TCN4_9BURK|nr:ISC system 2Fe-2S type ferredoxin [Massilia eurypsychrophila]PIL43825.1 ISC system 2Fe-2S type ferredoxin [Massilia eurypsychrophila]